MNATFGRLAVAIVIVGWATSTSGQQTQAPRPERPYTGLFGGGLGETEQALIATGSVSGGWDDNVLVAALQEPAFNANGANLSLDSAAYGQVGAGLSYTLTKKRIDFSTSLATSGRYFPGFSTPYVAGHSGNVGASLMLSRNARLTAGHGASFQPYQMLLLGPPIVNAELGEAVVAEQAFGVGRGEYISQTSGVAFNRKIGRRSSFDLNYGLTRTNSSSEMANLTMKTSGARLSTGVSRGLGLHFGYEYTDARQVVHSAASTLQGHNIDVGIDFSRSLSPSRRTQLSFSTGSSAIRYSDHLYYRVTGQANLVREIGRTWSASVAYDRGVYFVEQFREPFFNDGVTLSVGGLITRRLQFHSGASAIKAQVGLSAIRNDYRSYNAVTGVNVALSRYLGIGADYLYYDYDFNGQELLPANLSRRMGRHGARVSLSAWAPLFHRARKPDATR